MISFKAELIEIKDRYGDKRQTEIVDQVPDITREDMIKDEEVVVTITHRGYIKRTALDQYRAQLRGGKGKIGIVVRDEDFVDQIYTAYTHSYFIFFTNAGKAYSIKVHEIPEAPMTSKGKPLINLINAEKNESVTAIAHTREFEEDKYLLLVTKKGQVKKISLSALSHMRSTGLIVVKLPEGDSLMGILQTDGNNEGHGSYKEGQINKIQRKRCQTHGKSGLRNPGDTAQEERRGSLGGDSRSELQHSYRYRKRVW